MGNREIVAGLADRIVPGRSSKRASLVSSCWYGGLRRSVIHECDRLRPNGTEHGLEGALRMPMASNNQAYNVLGAGPIGRHHLLVHSGNRLIQRRKIALEERPTRLDKEALMSIGSVTTSSFPTDTTCKRRSPQTPRRCAYPNYNRLLSLKSRELFRRWQDTGS
jgi:hypothetical protein